MQGRGWGPAGTEGHIHPQLTCPGPGSWAAAMSTLFPPLRSAEKGGPRRNVRCFLMGHPPCVTVHRLPVAERGPPVSTMKPRSGDLAQRFVPDRGRRGARSPVI